MDFRKVVESKKDLKIKETDELVKIYEENDRKAWSEEKFEAIRQILQERGCPLPPQKGAPSAQRQAVSRDLSKYKGVKGWLLIFCLGLVLAPLGFGAKLYAEYQVLSPLFEQSPDLRITTMIYTILSIAVALLGVIVGVLLWAKKPRAVLRAQIFLLINMLYAVIVPLLFAGKLPKAPSLYIDQPFFKNVYMFMDQSFLIQVLPAFVLTGIWFFYFSRSKRVKATYR